MTRSLLKLFTLAVLFSGLYACVSNNDIEYQPQPLPELNFEAQRQECDIYSTGENRTLFLAYDSIEFTADIQELDSCKWDFGDGISTNLKSPTHLYTAPGEYTVKLTGYFPDNEIKCEGIVKVHALKVSNIRVRFLYPGMQLKHTTQTKAPDDLNAYLLIEDNKLENESSFTRVLERTILYRSQTFNIDISPEKWWVDCPIEDGPVVPPVHNHLVPEHTNFRLCYECEGKHVLLSGERYDPLLGTDNIWLIPFQYSHENDEYYTIGFSGPNGDLLINCTYE
jgi:hypothetical protein